MFTAIRNYFVTAATELQKVIWPTRREVVNHTFVIAASVLIAIILIGLIDYGLTLGLKEVILSK